MHLTVFHKPSDGSKIRKHDKFYKKISS